MSLISSKEDTDEPGHFYYYNRPEKVKNSEDLDEEQNKKTDVLSSGNDDLQTIINSTIRYLFSRVIPDKPRILTLEKAGKCLSVPGKIWNLSEYPPANFQHETSEGTEERLMDMEGYVDEYQYLHIKAVDMGLTDISVIPEHFVWLLSVDLSGNRLDNVTARPITRLPNIVALRLNRNIIEDPYLPTMKHLQYLGLNHNGIMSLNNIYHPNLETLDLNYNLINVVEARECWKLTKLMQLELRNNILVTTSGIEYSSLVNLYLAENLITALEGMEILVNLERLHLRQNPLANLSGFTVSNKNLKYLNIRQCEIATVEEIKELSVLTGLRELIVKGNLFNPELKEEESTEDNEEVEGEDESKSSEKGEEEDEYEDIRIQILMFLPFLERINKKVVTREDRENMEELLERSRSY